MNKNKNDSITILMALAICYAVTLLTGCALSTEIMVRPVHEYKAENRTYDRPLKCLFGNFSGCKSAPSEENQGS